MDGVYQVIGGVLILFGLISGGALISKAIKSSTDEFGGQSTLWAIFILGILGGLIFIYAGS